MARSVPGLRKRRTREHVIADQSGNHVERFIIEEGHAAQRVEKDYGYDLLLFTFDAEGYVEPDLAYLQLKAAEVIEQVGDDCVFDLDVRDYNLWMLERLPVFLVLFDASRRRAFWLHVQDYFRDDPSRRPRSGAKTVRVRVPARQRVGLRGVRQMCRTKREASGWLGTGGAP